MAEKENLEKDEMTKTQESSEEQIEETQDTEAQANAEKQEEVKEELSQEEKLKIELAELKDKHLRLYSEFENYRRRTSKERLDLIKTASEDVLKDIIPVVDDFERAIKASEKEESVETVMEGNLLIYNKLLKILESKGLKPMEDVVGKAFDADQQEAITQVPAPSEEMKGKVIDVIEKGYTLGDKVVRYAKVVIGS
ncbi:nucleotide exchange factor GrpE [Litoribacter ruber]|uniref:Protein GrpE n=1 Tax=Litoribacter ruber TaxID=702568 RepID=A0AAP2CF28_9BACT|nr:MULTISPECIES: nucleotide exchange factor GrpE [Litoribacter]MBS9522475.1 nucleotide exchange factor GrpE [Litoribacter alkaliphilus]MBT0810995.1 nucleotide exchange factor GrpE [Litoribacter ruber]